VSYSIIERHEGSISVSSEPGGGTVFTIDLPSMEVGPNENDEPETLATTPTLSVLVIDDEAAVRETLSEMLEALGHNVVLADGGQEALKRLAAAGDFDFVFTDLAMPEMDGWETSREIRKRRPDMRIVLVTGYGPGTVPPAGEETLVDGILGKPFDFVQVGDTIKNVLAKRAVLENVGV
jgi:CheY-like chemotaxis protein